MTDQITLNADLRERTGTNKAREIRNVDGMVPAIVYGDEKETLNIKLKLNRKNPIKIIFFILNISTSLNFRYGKLNKKCCCFSI